MGPDRAPRGGPARTATTALADPAIVADAAAFEANVGRVPFAFRHQLAGDHRLTFAATGALASTLPPGWQRPWDGTVPFVLDRPVPLDVSPAEVLADIASFAPRPLTIRLYHLELAPSYADVVDACLEAVPADAIAREGGERERNGAIFVGTPRARTAAHVDRHHNLLLQIEGTKRVWVAFFPDRHRQQREVERHVGPERLQASALPQPAAAFDLRPGDGLYIPPYAFHWIEVGDEPSLGLSASWSTAVTETALAAHEVNRRLRALRLRPAPVGSSAPRDRAKAAALRAWRRVKNGALFARR